MAIRTGTTEEWQETTIADFATATGGFVFPPAEQGNTKGDFPFYKVSDMNLSGNERCMTVANNWISESVRIKIKAKTFPARAIIFPKIGAAIATNKKRLLTQDSIIDNNVMGVVVTDENICIPEFLYLWFLTLDLEDLSNSGALPSIPNHRVHTASVLLPPFVEQKEIARVLTTVQDAITEQENLIAKLKELKRSMMQHLFTHGTKGEKTKMTEIGEVPESWDVVELIDVCDKPQYGFTDSASKDGNVKFLRITDITESGVNWNTVPFCSCPEPEKYLLCDGDIVFARIGATTGKSFLLKNTDNAVYASYLIRVRAKAIDSSFLYHYFQTGAYWKQIDSQKGMNLKGGVNGSILSKLLVPMCNGDEQLKIAASLNTIDARVESAQAKLASYQDLFKTLLHELMSGERRIKIV